MSDTFSANTQDVVRGKVPPYLNFSQEIPKYAESNSILNLPLQVLKEPPVFYFQVTGTFKKNV